jgi:hypothetical protein
MPVEASIVELRLARYTRGASQRGLRPRPNPKSEGNSKSEIRNLKTEDTRNPRDARGFWALVVCRTGRKSPRRGYGFPATCAAGLVLSTRCGRGFPAACAAWLVMSALSGCGFPAACAACLVMSALRGRGCSARTVRFLAARAAGLVVSPLRGWARALLATTGSAGARSCLACPSSTSVCLGLE